MKDIALAVINGLFGLAKQWWFWLALVILLGLFNVEELLKLASAAAEIIGKAKGS